MSIMNLLQQRKSVRTYTGEPVSRENLKALLDAANSAPAAMAQYDKVHITVIENPDLLDKIQKNAEAVYQQPDMLYHAPTFIVISGQPYFGGQLGNMEYSNAAIAAHNIALAAADLNVGCCYIWGVTAALAQNPELIQALNLPEGFIPCCGIVLGQTEETYEPRDIPEGRIQVNYVK